MEKKSYSQVLKSGILNKENSYEYGWKSFFNQLKILSNSEKKIITVDINGNIASGKTTLIQLIKDYFKENRIVYVVKENATRYEKFNEYVKNQKIWAFQFQFWLILNKEKQFKIINKKIRKKEKKVIIIWDRSISSDSEIFFKLMKKNGFINKPQDFEYQQKIQDLIKNGLMDSDLNIYLHSSPETCLERIKLRGIPSEVKSYNYNYIKTIHDLHEDFFNSTGNKNKNKNKLIVVNSDLDFESIVSLLKKSI
jgi:thymidine kinase